MANSKNYYDLLGVSRNASQEDIKKAYRDMARSHHPDMVKESDKAAAEKRFKEINEAYQVLSDPQKKSMYDQYGSATGPGGFGGGGAAGGQWGPFSYSSAGGAGGAQGGFNGFDPFDIFEEVFGFRGFGGAAHQRKGKNLYYEMRVEFADAVHGFEREISVESGKINVKVPAGIRTGTEMRFPGKGMPGPNNLPAGDLLISFRVQTPDEFQLIGEHIGIAMELSFVQAILGDTVEVPVVDTSSKSGIARKKVKVPAGTQHGTQIRLRGEGMPRLNRGGQGDVIIQVFVTIPKKVSKQQKKLLEDYQSL